MFADWVKLARLPNAVTAGLGVWLGHICLPVPVDFAAASLGSAAMAALAAAGNMQNDVLDVQVDRINRPDRPLPAGRIAVPSAIRAAWALYFLAAGLAFAINPPAGLLTLAMVLLLCLYNLKLKALPLWGNLAVALLCALAVYLPEAPLLPIHTGFPVLFAFLATLAREVAKDAEDVPGDRAAGLATLPIRFGIPAARGMVAAACLSVILLLPVPWLWLGYRAGYPIVAALGPLPLLAWSLARLAKSDTDWKAVQRTLKWAMLAGMAAIFAGVGSP